MFLAKESSEVVTYKSPAQVHLIVITNDLECNCLQILDEKHKVQCVGCTEGLGNGSWLEFVLDDKPYDSNIFTSGQVYFLLETPYCQCGCFEQKDHYLHIPSKSQ